MRRMSVLDRIHPDNLSHRTPALARIRPAANLRAIAITMALMLPLIGLIALVVPWQQSSSGVGKVVAYTPDERQQPVEAPIEGRIVSWLVTEGEVVTQGTPLVEIRDNDPGRLARLESQVRVAEAARDATLNRIESQRRKLAAYEEALDGTTRQMRAKLLSLRGKRLGLVASLATAELQADRISALAAEGLSSTRDAELYAMYEEKERAELEAMDRTILGAEQALRKETSLAQAKMETARTDLNKAEKELSDAEHKLLEGQTKLARQASQLVLAPRDGTVLSLHGGLGGGQVKKGDLVATLVPASSSLAVELAIDGNDMPLLQPGVEARVVFEGWPAMQFVGLRGASQGTFAGKLAFVDSSDNGTGKFRAVVVPAEGADWPAPSLLRQGVRAKGFLLLGQVPLGYELWRQINGFPALPSVTKGDASVLPKTKKPRAPASLK